MLFRSYEYYKNDSRIQRVIEDLRNGKYVNDPERFNDIYQNLLTYNDEFFVLKDFASYIDASNKADEIYRDTHRWQKMCAINIAHSGIFSSDRTISEYATGIWGSDTMYKNL